MAPKKKLTKEEQEAERQRQEEEAKVAEQGTSAYSNAAIPPTHSLI